MRSFLAASLLALCVPGLALAQAPAKPPLPSKSACADCGVVRSIKKVTKEVKPGTSNQAKPSGLVATVPLGKTDEKPRIGSSSKVGKDVVTKTDTWQVTIQLDDGRFKVMTLDEDPNVREGEKVRVDAAGKIQPRAD
jgi:hypothetical protein